MAEDLVMANTEVGPVFDVVTMMIFCGHFLITLCSDDSALQACGIILEMDRHIRLV